MCLVSNMGDAGRKIFDPWVQPTPEPPPYAPPYQIKPGVTREEHEQLRRDMEALRELLKAAQKVDKAQGLADCEMEEKIEFIKAVAELLGVSLEDVWPEN